MSDVYPAVGVQKIMYLDDYLFRNFDNVEEII